MIRSQKFLKLVLLALFLLQSKAVWAGSSASKITKFRDGFGRLMDAQANAKGMNPNWVAKDTAYGDKAFVHTTEEGRMLTIADVNMQNSSVNQYSMNLKSSSQTDQVTFVNHVSASGVPHDLNSLVQIERRGVDTGMKTKELVTVNESMSDLPAFYKDREEFAVPGLGGSPGREKPIVTVDRSASDRYRSLVLKQLTPDGALKGQLDFKLGIDGSISSWHHVPSQSRLTVFVVKKGSTDVTEIQYQLVASASQPGKLEARQFGDVRTHSAGAAQRLGLLAKKIVYKDVDHTPDLPGEVSPVLHGNYPAATSANAAR